MTPIDGSSTNEPTARLSASTPARYEPPSRRLYAASLDEHMCDACAAQAGREFDALDPATPMLPNPDCTSRNGCRCAWLRIAGSESTAPTHSPSGDAA